MHGPRWNQKELVRKITLALRRSKYTATRPSHRGAARWSTIVAFFERPNPDVTALWFHGDSLKNQMALLFFSGGRDSDFIFSFDSFVHTNCFYPFLSTDFGFDFLLFCPLVDRVRGAFKFDLAASPSKLMVYMFLRCGRSCSGGWRIGFFWFHRGLLC